MLATILSLRKINHDIDQAIAYGNKVAFDITTSFAVQYASEAKLDSLGILYHKVQEAICWSDWQTRADRALRVCYVYTEALAKEYANTPEPITAPTPVVAPAPKEATRVASAPKGKVPSTQKECYLATKEHFAPKGRVSHKAFMTYYNKLMREAGLIS